MSLACHGRPNGNLRRTFGVRSCLARFSLPGRSVFRSPLGVTSWPVCQTLWQAWRGWATFYLVAAALLATAGIILVEAFPSEAFWGTIIAVTAETAAWFIYFRLLGRLAWYCTDLARKRAEADDEGREDSDP